MDLETAKQLSESSVVQSYIEQIDTDAEAALDTMKSNLSAMAAFAKAAASEYRSDGATLDSAWGDFNEQWNRVVFGKATTARRRWSPTRTTCWR